MKNWKLITLIVLLAFTFLPVPLALAQPCDTNDACPVVRAPEPGTFLLLAPGLVGLAGIAWRRNRRK